MSWVIHHCCCVVSKSIFSLFSVISRGGSFYTSCSVTVHSTSPLCSPEKRFFKRRPFFFRTRFVTLVTTFAKLSSRKNSPFKEDPESSVSTVPGSNQKKHRSRSTSRYVEEKPKKKKAVANVSLVSIPNTIRLSVLNSGLFPICE